MLLQDTPYHVDAATGAENMALDLAMLQTLESTNQQWLWRFYTWEPWCVSLGKHQHVSAVNAQRAAAHGIHTVHRPTGGRAVLHADELTYCVVSRMPANDLYNLVHQTIHAALLLVLGTGGDVLEFDTVGSDLRSHYASGSDLGAACFATSARSEVMAGGRKVVGSAQRAYPTMVLQHGSILCSPAHLLLAELVNIPDDRRPAFRAALERSSISLSELAGQTVTPTDVARALSNELAQTQQPSKA